MTKRLLTLFIYMWPLLSATSQTNDLPRTSPEAVGLRSGQVIAFFDSLMAYPKTEIHSVIVMRQGKVVGEMYPEPFRADYPLTQFSCSKTFVAAAVGIAISEKLLRLDDHLVDFVPDHLPKMVSWRLKSITVRDLLTMRSGFVVNTQIRNRSLQWIRDYLAHPMNAKPGKRFQYDSINTYLLSAIVQKVTGMTVLDYLKLKVFNSLNIRNVKWELSPEGITTGGWGLYIQAESLAKFGQLLLQRGNWHDEQLIPAKWVDEMMKVQVNRSPNDSYGYQMWQCKYPTAFRADGAFGQYIIIVPKEQVVVVINQCTTNSGEKERAFIWDTLFKGMQKEPLKPSPDYQRLLQSTWSLPLLTDGAERNKLLDPYIGKTLRLSKNPLGWSRFRFDSESTLVVTDTAGVSSPIDLGYQSWKATAIDFYPLNARYVVKNRFSTINGPYHVAACYAWQDDELLAKLHFTDWMASVLLRFRFNGNSVAITAIENYQNKPLSITATPLEPVENTDDGTKKAAATGKQ